METKDKSDILGKGYGDKHNWKRVKSYQLAPEQYRHLSTQEYLALKGTEYKCKNCGQFFIHRYDMIPDIFKAMKTVGVLEECKVNKLD